MIPTKLGTRYPFFTPNPAQMMTTTTSNYPDGHGEEESTIYPGIEPYKPKRRKNTTPSSFTISFTTRQKYGITTEQPVNLYLSLLIIKSLSFSRQILNYCRLLNCDFNGMSTISDQI